MAKYPRAGIKAMCAFTTVQKISTNGSFDLKYSIISGSPVYDKSFLKENPRVIKTLLGRGADPNIRNKEGKLYSEITRENLTFL